MNTHHRLTLAASLLGLSILSPAHAALNDTGITTCSNLTQNGLACPVSGFPGQDAEYGTNKFNFTKLDANGYALVSTATVWSCVQDNTTGLVWEVKTVDGGLRDQTWTYTWYDSNTSTNGGAVGTASGTTNCKTTGRCDTEKFVQDVNAVGLCGHNDWRLPSKEELLSIVDNGRYNPSIDTDYFPNTVSNWFWSSSANANDSSYSWIVAFDYGYVGGNDRSSNGAVRLVRGGQ